MGDGGRWEAAHTPWLWVQYREGVCVCVEMMEAGRPVCAGVDGCHGFPHCV